jgi:uncharacterized protein (TIGR04222 family)
LAVLALALLATVGAVGTAPSPVRAQDTRAVEWNRFDVTLRLQPDGSFVVRERQEVEFRGGPFRTGWAELPLTNVVEIPRIAVGEEVDGTFQPFEYVVADEYEAEAGTFTVDDSSTALEIEYAYEPAEDETRIFVIEYLVIGALWVYPEDPPVQQIRWTAIDDEVTAVAPVREATFTVVLPQPVSLDQVEIEGDADGEPSEYSEDGQTFVFTKQDLEEGDRFEVWLQFPAVANAAPAPWQERADEEAAEEEAREERSALLNLMFLLAGLLLAVVGGLGIYGLWYGRGRDPHEGLVADFLPQPPDDLPAGAAGALLDERVDEQDAVATMLDLAHRGAIKLEEIPGEGVLGIGSGRDFKLTLLKADLAMRPLQQDLLKALFPDQKDGTETKLSEVKPRFDAHRDELAEDIYAELVDRGYFARSPEATRRSWQSGTRIGLIAAIIVGIGVCVAFVGDAGLVVLPVAVAIVLAFVLYRLSGAMPQKTRAGAEAVAKWRAFRRYLDDIEKYEGVDEAKTTFDRYLPYAVAFGLERSWVAKFASVRTPTPPWFESIPGGFGGDVFAPQNWDPSTGRRRRRGGTVIVGGGGWGGGGWGGWGDGGSGRGGGGGFDVDLPDMQDASDRAGRTLQGSSDGLFKMLNVAATVFGAMASGGGGGGGGFRGGGFGGGGGRSSGGGGRGFG